MKAHPLPRGVQELLWPGRRPARSLGRAAEGRPDRRPGLPRIKSKLSVRVRGTVCEGWGLGRSPKLGYPFSNFHLYTGRQARAESPCSTRNENKN